MHIIFISTISLNLLDILCTFFFYVIYYLVCILYLLFYLMYIKHLFNLFYFLFFAHNVSLSLLIWRKKEAKETKNRLSFLNQTFFIKHFPYYYKLLFSSCLAIYTMRTHRALSCANNLWLLAFLFLLPTSMTMLEMKFNISQTPLKC